MSKEIIVTIDGRKGRLVSKPTAECPFSIVDFGSDENGGTSPVLAEEIDKIMKQAVKRPGFPSGIEILMLFSMLQNKLKKPSLLTALGIVRKINHHLEARRFLKFLTDAKDASLEENDLLASPKQKQAAFCVLTSTGLTADEANARLANITRGEIQALITVVPKDDEEVVA